jgi:hypothetical protein
MGASPSSDDVLASLPGDLVPGGALLPPRSTVKPVPLARQADLTVPPPPAANDTAPPGLSPDLAQRVQNNEGLGKADPNSSAVSGFMPDTWATITMGEPEVAGKTPDQIQQLRITNPAFVQRMTQKSLTQGQAYLQSKGLPVNDETVYLTHFFGAVGAERILRAPPNTPLNKIFAPQVMQANPQLAGLTTSSVLPYLGQSLAKTPGPGNAGYDPSDPATQQHLRSMADLDRIGTQMTDLVTKMGQAPAGSDEAHRLLHQAIDRSQMLADRFDKLSQKPPQPQSPFEAAGAFTPLLIGLTMMMGRRTRRPGLAAINALSAGLGALKQGNDENYKNAVDMWSKQSDLAMKAFELQNKMIDNIMSDINLSAKEQQDKLQNAFRVLGLEQELSLAKNSQWDAIYKRHDDALKLQAELDEKKAQTQHVLAQTQREKALTALGGSTNPVMIAYNKARIAFVDQNGREPSPVEDQKLLTDAQASSKTAGHPLSTEQKALDDAFTAKANELGVSPDEFKTDDRYAADRQKIEQSVMTFRHQSQITGNEKVRLEQRVTQYDTALNRIDDMEELLATNSFIAGVGGKVTRPLEALENVTGWSQDTDRAQFESGIAFLKAVSGRLIEQSDSRGVSAELYGKEQRIDQIIRGMRMGDTTARTVESLRELKGLFQELGQQTNSMLQGTWQTPKRFGGTQPPAAAPALQGVAPPAATPGQSNPWASFHLDQ